MNVRVIPVIDLRGGVAVHARGGERDAYRPVQSLVCEGSDPFDLARAYRDRLGLGAVYLADLDAIAGALPSTSLYRRICGLGLELWVDAGALDARGLAGLREAGAARVIVATETLDGPCELSRLASEADPGALVFGLDLRAGRVVVAPGAHWPSTDPIVMAGAVWSAGVRRFLILDLASVGVGAGVAGLSVAASLVKAYPGAEVAVGGGVDGPADLIDAEVAGASAVLVGSALHDGRITRADLGHPGSGPQVRST